jgi:hypothetical protein
MLALQAICHALEVVEPAKRGSFFGTGDSTAESVIACNLLCQAKAICFHYLVFYLSSRMPTQFGHQEGGGLGHAPWVQCPVGWCKSAVHGRIGWAFGEKGLEKK